MSLIPSSASRRMELYTYIYTARETHLLKGNPHSACGRNKATAEHCILDSAIRTLSNSCYPLLWCISSVCLISKFLFIFRKKKYLKRKRKMFEKELSVSEPSHSHAQNHIPFPKYKTSTPFEIKIKPSGLISTTTSLKVHTHKVQLLKCSFTHLNAQCKLKKKMSGFL